MFTLVPCSRKGAATNTVALHPTQRCSKYVHNCKVPELRLNPNRRQWVPLA